MKILKNHHPIQFTRKSAFNIWQHVNQHKWHLDCDPVKSAQKVLEHAAGETLISGSPWVTTIPIKNQEYYEGLTFAVLDILWKWGSHIREVLMDSSCKFKIILIIDKHLHAYDREVCWRQLGALCPHG